MKLKELESYLSQCEAFSKPKIKLEQYPTSAHIASRMIFAAQDYIKGASVLDLGSGCGILSIGSVLVEAAYVLGLEIDPDAVQVARENASCILDEDSAGCLNFVQINIRGSASTKALHRFADTFDVVIMNPPFGTKNNEGIDWDFVQLGLKLVRPGGRIYSLHKTSTRPFFIKKFKTPLLQQPQQTETEPSTSKPDEEELQILFKVSAKVLAEVQFNLPKVYKFHKDKSVDILVDFWCFEKLS